MMRAATVLAGALALFPTLLPAVCDSRVFIDTNRNGVFDAGERGLSGVAVSDGVHIVRSDRDGRYRLAAMPGKTLFVIKPSGYALPKRADGLPDFFANQAGSGAKLKYGGVVHSDTACKSFALNPEAQNPELPLSVLLFGDPQPKSAVVHMSALPSLCGWRYARGDRCSSASIISHRPRASPHIGFTHQKQVPHLRVSGIVPDTIT
jgi:hypothetical protein